MAFDPAKYGAKPVATSTQGFDPNKYGAKPVQKVSNSVMPQVTPSPTWSSGGKSFADIIPHSTYNPEYTGFGNIFKAVGNIPHEVATAVENVARVPKAIYDTVTDPNVKARGFLGGAKDFATSVYDVAGKPLTQGLSTLGNTLLGGLQAGVQATTGINIGDKNAEQAWNSKAENTYNLVQSIQRGLVENPLATAAMTAEGVRQVRGLPKGTDAVSSMARPVIDTTKIAASPVLQPISNTLSASAETSIVKSLAPTTKANKVTASRVASQALERPMGDTFAFTRQGLENKAIKGKEIAGQAIEDFGKLTGESKTSSIIDALEKEKAQYTAGGVVVNADAVGQLTKVQDIIRQYGDTIDNETLRGVRRIFDTEVKKSKGFAVPPSEGSLIEAKKIAADNIRGILAETNPDLAKLNKEYNFWANLEQVVRDTNQRTQGQVGIGKDIATLAGAASGNGITGMVLQGLTFRWLGSAIKSTGWRLVSARIKSSIADALASGDLAAVNDILSGISKNPTMLAEWSAMQSQMPSLRQTSISTIPTTKPISTVIPTSKPRTPSQSTPLSTATRQVVSSPKSTPAKASVANDPAIIRRLTRERGAVGTPSDEWLLASAQRELKKTPNDAKLKAFVAEKELMAEARKYKTAEEFVKGQEGGIKQAQTGKPVTARMYHGSPDARFAEEFDPTKAGYYKDAPDLLPDMREWESLNGKPSQGFRGESVTGNKGVSFTDSRATAKSYSEKPAFDTQNSVPMVLERYVTLKNPKVYDMGGKKWDLNMEQEMRKALENGHDGLVFKNILDDYHPFNSKTPANNIIVLDTNAIKTRSQLTDIWNKANKGNQTPVLPNQLKKVSDAGGVQKYGMSHRPAETGATADDISKGGEVIPKDFYEHPEWYANMKDKSYQESFSALNKIKGNPNATVTIYRASPKNEINRGDWVSLSKTYAKGESLSEKTPVHSFKVKAKDIQFAGDDINEFGYYPKD